MKHDVQNENKDRNKSGTEKNKQEKIVEHARHIFPCDAIFKNVFVIRFTTIEIRMNFGVDIYDCRFSFWASSHKSYKTNKAGRCNIGGPMI